jgi:hypothetical protein
MGILVRHTGVLIAVLSASGVNPHNLLTWKEQSKHTMRLSIGLLYVLLVG